MEWTLKDHTVKQQAFHRFFDCDDHFRCPHCGATNAKGNFSIDETYCPLDPPGTTFSECAIIHKEDCCYCEVCQWSGTVQQVFNATKKRLSLTPCSSCKGTGWVKVKVDSEGA